MPSIRYRRRHDRSSQFVVTQGINNLATDAKGAKTDETEHKASAERYEAAWKKIPLRISIRGGDAHRRFRHIPILKATLDQVSTESALQGLLHDDPRIGDQLRDIYGLSIYADYQESILLTTAGESCLSSPFLDLEKATSGKLTIGKDKAIFDQIAGSESCHCGDPCKGMMHPAEVHVILNLSRLMGRTTELHEADILNKEMIGDLEREKKHLKRENEDLQSQVLGLRLTREDLDAASGIGGRLRKRKRTVHFAG